MDLDGLLGFALDRGVVPFIIQKERNMKRTMILLLTMMFSMAMLSGCNTMAGVGKDVQKAGEKVEGKAKDCKDGRC